MKTNIIAVIVMSLCVSVLNAGAQTKEKPNADIQKMLKEISAKNIETTIRKLVSFGTRNTLSEQDNPTRGIGAARDYLYGEFQKISTDCGNCLQVEKQTFLQPKAARVAEPTNLTNVYAVLKGTTDPARVYVVSGHYDSMCTSPTDAKCDAPGANDDASGTSAVIEMARVMSKYKFDATIIFMTVPGEEQGLLGATYFAQQALEKKMDIEAMFTNDIIGGVTSFKNAREPADRARFFGRRSVKRNRAAGKYETRHGRRKRFGFAPARPVYQRNNRFIFPEILRDDGLPARQVSARRRSYSISGKGFYSRPHHGN